jgi:DNA-binding transcriptional MerR regulator
MTTATDNMPKEVADQPTPFGFTMNLAQALESRIDYNFNSIIQLSMLVEFLYDKLEEKGLGIELDESFQKFQEERLADIKKQFQEITESVNKETEAAAKQAVEEIAEKLDLKDN